MARKTPDSFEETTRSAAAQQPAGQPVMPAGTPSPPNAPLDSSAMPTASWQLVVPGLPDALPQVRGMIEEATVHCGFSPEEIAKIEMAVDEACTNVMEHAYQTLSRSGSSPQVATPASPSHLEIEVRAQGFPDRLEITILDRSLYNFPVHEQSGIDVHHYLAEERKRGLGLYIIRSFVDDVQHRFIEGYGNELLLVKYFA